MSREATTLQPDRRARPRGAFRVLAAVLLSLVLALAGCGGKAGSKLLTVAGSTSVQPFAEKLAEMYMELDDAETVNVQGGGSSAGIMAVIGGAAQIGTSSRELNECEVSQVAQYPIAWDGIAVVVHRDNPLRNLTLAQVRAIFAGWVTNWRQLGLALDHDIDAISREEGSGTRNAFEELVMKKTNVSDGCLVQDSNGAVRELVATDPYAIGYISVGLVDARVKTLAIDGVLPTGANIKNHSYSLTRPFLFVTKGEPQGGAKRFVEFVLGPTGQAMLEREGLVGAAESTGQPPACPQPGSLIRKAKGRG
jgi:phosphate transport system substrate-binding protein